MNWKLKSKIKNAIAILPFSLTYPTYYWFRHYFIKKRQDVQINPVGKISMAAELCKRICKNGGTVSNKIFFEIGTGRDIIMPIGYWLMGAEKIITIDLNHYLRSELVAESLHYLCNNQAKNKIFNLPGIDKERFGRLLELSKKTKISLLSIFDLCQIEYISPGDAANTKLPDASIDFYTSYNVLEHIPLAILEKIILEGNRIIKNKGLFVHRIDYTDHFAHSDNSISLINFLQYSDKEWDRLAGNRFMYMNRLRHDDFVNLFNSSMQHIVDVEQEKNDQMCDILNSKTFKLNERFKDKSKDILAITSSWIVLQKSDTASLLKRA